MSTHDPSASIAWEPFMDRALELATNPLAPRGENPRVGCVIVNELGAIVGEGWHEGAGTAHAEVVALVQAGDHAVGATAVVTLEPCNHHGRTGPCARALIDAGISRVVFAQADPTTDAGGGSRALAAADVEVVSGVREVEAAAVNREWTIAATRGWPFVTAKCAVSLDGRVAGPEGQPVALTGPEANRYSHEIRARVQAIVVGTQTVVNDDPQLTIRYAQIPVSGQPLRVAVGNRDVPNGSRIADSSAPFVQIREHDPRAVLAELHTRGIRHLLLEGGPTLLRAFVAAGLVDELVWFISGVWLGAGPRPLPEGSRLDRHAAVVESLALGQDVLMRMILQGKGV